MTQNQSNQQETTQNPADFPELPQLTEAQQLAMSKLWLDIQIGDCKKCYNRRYLGVNVTYGKIVKCSCLIKFEMKVEKARLEGKEINEVVS